MSADQRQHLRTVGASGQRPKGFNTKEVDEPRRATEFELTARKRAYQSFVALRGSSTSFVLKNLLVPQKEQTHQIALKRAPSSQRSAA
jgi:hypothetical protein